MVLIFNSCNAVNAQYSIYFGKNYFIFRIEKD